MKKLPTQYLLLAVLGVAACAAPTLDQKLAGKTGPKRMKTLYHECIQKANYGIPGGHSNAYTGHETRMWKICDRMYEAGKTQAPDEVRAGLAQECSAEMRGGLKPDHPANMRHFQQKQRICEEMTGKQVNL